MAIVGTSLSYKNQRALSRLFAKHVQGLNDVALKNMTKYTKMFSGKGSFCYTTNGLAPVDDDELYLPRSIGDICLRMSGSTVTSAHIAVSGNFADPAIARVDATADWVIFA